MMPGSHLPTIFPPEEVREKGFDTELCQRGMFGGGLHTDFPNRLQKSLVLPDHSLNCVLVSMVTENCDRFFSSSVVGRVRHQFRNPFSCLGLSIILLGGIFKALLTVVWETVYEFGVVKEE